MRKGFIIIGTLFSYLGIIICYVILPGKQVRLFKVLKSFWIGSEGCREYIHNAPPLTLSFNKHKHPKALSQALGDFY